MDHYFSNERLNRYYRACQQDMDMALRLYHANSRLANEFRTLLIDHLEVYLRNALNQKIAAFLEDPDWLLKQYEQLPYMQQKYRIKEIKTRYHEQGWSLDHNELVAKLNLKFWESLLYERPYATLKGRPLQVFTNRPSGFSRKKVVNKIASVRRFRNRITHGEPIIFARQQPIISLYQARCVYKKIYTLLDWLCPLMIPLVQRMEQVEVVAAEIEQEFRWVL